MAALGTIQDTVPDAYDHPIRYVALYDAVLREDRMWQCGMLSTEFVTLAAPVRMALTQFVEANQGWLLAMLDNGPPGRGTALRWPGVGHCAGVHRWPGRRDDAGPVSRRPGGFRRLGAPADRRSRAGNLLSSWPAGGIAHQALVGARALR